jgi:hypothetical protein
MPSPEDDLATDPKPLIGQLRSTSETMPAELRSSIVALGAAVTPDLLAVLEDPELAAEDSPAGGWPPIHAADLLVELRAESAIGPLLKLLREGDLDDILSLRIAVELPRFGAAAQDPLLAELASTTDPERRLTLCEILSCLGLRDERVWNAVSGEFYASPVLCASFLARYGDPRGIPLIEDALYDCHPDDKWARHDIRALVEAYKTLAGALPDELAQHVEDLVHSFDVPAPAPVGATKIGRNDPCPCGSGKKYKRCCLA